MSFGCAANLPRARESAGQCWGKARPGPHRHHHLFSAHYHLGIYDQVGGRSHDPHITGREQGPAGGGGRWKKFPGPLTACPPVFTCHLCPAVHCLRCPVGTPLAHVGLREDSPEARGQKGPGLLLSAQGLRLRESGELLALTNPPSLSPSFHPCLAILMV